ncbi:DUF362 domain-containing protein [bacterium]|nr:DUF362 domain-containing protein [bacterium]
MKDQQKSDAGKTVFTRRDFMRSAMGAAAAAGLSGKAQSQAAKPARMSRVVLVRNEGVIDAENKVNKEILTRMLDETMIKLTGEKTAGDAWRSLFKPEDTVGLVPTQLMNPSHPELIEAVTAALVEAGVSSEKIITAQGRDPEKAKSCTALINMPGIKAHWLTGIGTVLKNYILFSGRPRDYHMADSVKLGEIWNLDFVKGKTRLNLVDAINAVCDKGPQFDPQYKWAYKGLIAGTDPVAVETVCLKIITEKRNLMKGESWPLSPPPVSVEAADRVYGLGTSQWEEIALEKSGWMQEVLV